MEEMSLISSAKYYFIPTITKAYLRNNILFLHIKKE